MSNRIPRPLRPFVLLAPGAVLVAAFYWIDYPPAGSGVYPRHDWSTAGVLLGWWLVLVALTLIGRTGFTALLALLSALALGTVNGDDKTLITGSWLPQVGVLGAALVLLVATSAEVVTVYGWRGRMVWAIVLPAVGAGVIVLNGLNSSIPVVDSPAGEVLATLVAAPVFIGVRWAWQWRYGPADKGWLAGCPWFGWVALISSLWAINIAVQPIRRLEAPDIVAYGGAIVVVVLVAAGAWFAAPRLGSWAEGWLGSTGTEAAAATDPGPVSGLSSGRLEWDGTQIVPVNQPGGAAISSKLPRREFFSDWPGYVLAGCIGIIFAGSLLIFAYILLSIAWQRAQQGDFLASIISAVILLPIALLIVLAVRGRMK